MTFGEKLKFYRKQAGLTQADLAEKAELTVNTICNYEKGYTYPQDRKVYQQLAEILNVDEDELKNETRKKIATGIDAGSLSKRAYELWISEFVNLEAVFNPPEIDTNPELYARFRSAGLPCYPSEVGADLARQVNKMVFHKTGLKKPHMTSLTGEPEVDEAIYKVMAYMKDKDVSDLTKEKVITALKQARRKGQA